MKKDAETNSLKMTNKKERHMLTTVYLPVRKKFKNMIVFFTAMSTGFLCFSCPLHKLWGFLSVEGQSVPKSPM